jgi:hypothetical protein
MTKSSCARVCGLPPIVRFAVGVPQLVAAYLLAWTAAYLLIVGLDFTWWWQWMRVAWTSSAGELAGFCHVCALFGVSIWAAEVSSVAAGTMSGRQRWIIRVFSTAAPAAALYLLLLPVTVPHAPHLEIALLVPCAQLGGLVTGSAGIFWLLVVLQVPGYSVALQQGAYRGSLVWATILVALAHALGFLLLWWLSGMPPL